jgi:hypothetical protein
VKAFIGVDIAAEGCVPVCGSMQGTFASFLTSSQADPKKDTVFIYRSRIPCSKDAIAGVGY